MTHRVLEISVEFVCVQCALKHLVTKLEAHEEPGPPPTFEGRMQAHIDAVHPDQEATQRERQTLLARYAELMEREQNTATARALNARNN